MISAFSIPFHRLFLSVLSAFQNQFFSPSSVLTLPCSTLFRSMSLSSVSPTVSVVLSVYSPYFLFSLWHCTTNANLSPLYSNNRSTVPPRPKICMRGRGRYAQEGAQMRKGTAVQDCDSRSHPGNKHVGQPAPGAGLRRSPTPAATAHVTLG